jgi:hypothetical protein
VTHAPQPPPPPRVAPQASAGAAPGCKILWTVDESGIKHPSMVCK